MLDGLSRSHCAALLDRAGKPRIGATAELQLGTVMVEQVVECSVLTRPDENKHADQRFLICIYKHHAGDTSQGRGKAAGRRAVPSRWG